MYADEAIVRRLARNVQVLSSEDLAAVASGVDSEIDAALQSVFDWPFDTGGEPYPYPIPALVRTIANYMTAGMVETRAYAQQQGGEAEPSNPYGGRLLNIARNLLNRLTEGNLSSPGLIKRKRTLSRAPVQQFKGIGGRSRHEGPPWRR